MSTFIDDLQKLMTERYPTSFDSIEVQTVYVLKINTAEGTKTLDVTPNTPVEEICQTVDQILKATRVGAHYRRMAGLATDIQEARRRFDSNPAMYAEKIALLQRELEELAGVSPNA